MPHTPFTYRLALNSVGLFFVEKKMDRTIKLIIERTEDSEMLLLKDAHPNSFGLTNVWAAIHEDMLADLKGELWQIEDRGDVPVLEIKVGVL